MVDNKPSYGAGGHSFTLHRAEADRLAELKQWWEKTTGETQDPSGATQLGNLGPSRSAKTALLGEVGKSNFFDAAFKVGKPVYIALTSRFYMSTRDNKWRSSSTPQTGPSRHTRPATSTMSRMTICLQMQSFASTYRTSHSPTRRNTSRLGTS